MQIDLDYEEYALKQEAALVAAWTIDPNVPEEAISSYLAATGYGKRLAAYKAARLEQEQAQTRAIPIVGA